MADTWRRLFSIGIFLLASACAVAQPPSIYESRPVVPSPSGQAASDAIGAGETVAPVAEGSIRFAVLGDTGTGERPQYEVAAQLWRSHSVFPYEFVIMVGDNLYGSERPEDYARKFELPYKPLLDASIEFYASLGNHDDRNQIFYKPFNMNGSRFYTFTKEGADGTSVRFFALDSTYMDREQLDWLEKELASANEEWKIAFFHHPLYSSGARHGSEVDLREQLEPLFIRYGINVVFAGHEHFYERVKPQHGIYYFTAGGSAKLREGNIEDTTMTAAGFDTDRSFVLVEIAGDTMHFQALSRTGKRVDGGALERQPHATPFALLGAWGGTAGAVPQERPSQIQ